MLMPGRYISDTSQHCMTISTTKWVTTTQTNWVSVCLPCLLWWEYGNGHLQLMHDTVALLAISHGDTAYGFAGTDISVTPGVPNQLLIDQIAINGQLRFAIMEDSGGTYKELTSVLADTRDRKLGPFLFTPTGNTIHLTVANLTPTKKVWWKIGTLKNGTTTTTTPVTVYETVCNEDKDKYRFGFNGQLKDNDWAGIGNSLDFGARVYDSRSGKWLSMDKLNYKYPAITPYGFSLNSPIRFKDSDGNDVKVTISDNSINFSSTIYVTGPNAESLVSEANAQFANFSKAALKGRTYKDVISGIEYNVVISMNFVAVDPDNPNDPNYQGYMDVVNASPGVNGNNIIEITTNPENLYQGRADADFPAGENYSNNSYYDEFVASSGKIQANRLSGVGNKAFLAVGDGSGTAIHETFHLFGLGDRYFEKMLYNFIDALGNTGQVSVQSSQLGYENDLMSKRSRATNLSGVDFNQTHINNLAQAALSTYRAKKQDFVMGKRVDNESSSNVKKAPSTFTIDGTKYNKANGQEIK